MKRIANDVAIQTIAYTLHGNQYVSVVDYPTPSDATENRYGKEIFYGRASDFYSYKYDRIMRSKVLDTKIQDGNIVFKTCQAYDEF